jgi:hypothetical protein
VDACHLFEALNPEYAGKKPKKMSKHSSIEVRYGVQCLNMQGLKYSAYQHLPLSFARPLQEDKFPQATIKHGITHKESPKRRLRIADQPPRRHKEEFILYRWTSSDEPTEKDVSIEVFSSIWLNYRADHPPPPSIRSVRQEAFKQLARRGRAFIFLSRNTELVEPTTDGDWDMLNALTFLASHGIVRVTVIAQGFNSTTTKVERFAGLDELPNSSFSVFMPSIALIWSRTL